MIDCLLIGYNETSFTEDLMRIRAMGTNSISYKDLNLGFIEYEDKPYRALDILTHFYYEGKDGVERKVFHNADVLWQVIMYLGTYLKKNGFTFDYVNLFHLEKDKLRTILEEEEIKTIVITTTIYISVHPILEIVDFIRKYNTTAKIIVGGPYISKQSEEVDLKTNQSIFKMINADFYVISLEGEKTLVNLLKEINGNGNYHLVDNIAYRDGDNYIFTSHSKENNSLEENMIDYSLFPAKELRKTVNVRTSKSCPFSCAYCGFPLRAEKYTYVSVERVERELNALRDRGCVEYINFIDDTFNIPKTRFKEILRMMIRNKYPFKWFSFYRCDFGDEETIELMKQAGCIGVFLGVESANNEMLERMNKTSRLEHYQKAIPLLKQAGIYQFVSTIIGFPGETYESAKETLDFIEEMQPDFFRPQIWWSDPLTPIWQKRKEYGIKGLGFNWVHNTMDSKTAYDLFEKTFLSVENSIWVPDPGFNAYGMYYLLERGMTMEQVKNFLRCFNAVVKEKILFPGKPASPILIENLQRSARFDEQVGPDMDLLAALSGASYKAAERYWVDEFADVHASVVPHFTSVSGETEDEWETCAVGPLDSGLIARLTGYGADPAKVFLAAYCLILSRLNVLDNVAVIVAGKNGAMPVKLEPNDGLTFLEYLHQTEAKLVQADKHSLFAFNILSSPWRMKEHGKECPKFEFAFQDGVELKSALAYHPEIYHGIGLILSVNKESNSLTLCFREKCFSREAVSKIGDYLANVLQTIADNPKLQLSEVGLVQDENEEWLKTFEEEVFNF